MAVISFEDAMSIAYDTAARFITLNPVLVPAFEGLRREHFTEDTKGHRDQQKARIYHELFYGKNGISAASEFTEVHHNIIAEFAEKIPLKDIGSSVIDFFIKHDLAAVSVGGSAARTMGPESDYDIFILSPDSCRFSEKGTEFQIGLTNFNSNIWNVLNKAGMPCVKTCVYAPGFIPEDLLNKDQLVNITSLLSTEFLFGKRGVYSDFLKQFSSCVCDKRDLLVENIYEEVHRRHKQYGFSPYAKESNLKESPGYLRDLDAIRWLQKIVEITEGPEAADKILSPQEKQAVWNAKSIFLQLKFFAQYTLPPGMDSHSERINVLSHDRMAIAFQSFAAIIPPTQDRGRDAYRLRCEQSGNVLEILAKVFDKVRRKPVPDNPPIYVGLDPALNIPTPDVVRTSLRLMSELARTHKFTDEDRGAFLFGAARAAVDLVRENLAKASDDIFRAADIRDEFMRIIAESSKVSGGIRMLHQSGVLVRLLPCFAETLRLNEIDSYLESTLDEHSIEAVEALPCFFTGEIKGTESFYKNFEHLRDRPELVLATLIHDVGRRNETAEKTHDEIGAELAERDLRNPIVTKLVGAHSLLWKLAFSFASNNKSELKNAASIIGNQETLDMLFVLSWVDKMTSNRHEFTAPKQRWLLQLYYNLKQTISEGAVRIPEPSPLITAALSARKSGEDFKIADVSGHLENLPERYRYECEVNAIAEHVTLLRDFAGVPRLSWLPRINSEDPSLHLALVAADRPGLFRDIAYAIYNKRLEIEDAQIFTRKDGIACNIFSLSDTSHNQVMARVEENRQRLLLSLSKLVVDPPLERDFKLNLSQNISFQRASLNVFFRNSTELCIECPDFSALAFLIGESLTEQGLIITSAKLHTGNRGQRHFFQVENASGDELPFEQRQKVERTITGILNFNGPREFSSLNGINIVH
jgi:[protein-PII] uridylyltransferase